MKAYVTIGIPCSGKSTWAQNKSDRTGEVVLERDEIRMDLFNLERYNDYQFSREKEEKVTKRLYDMARDCASKGQSIIISDTNLNQKNRSKLVSDLAGMGFDPSEKVFPISFDDAMKRNESRAVSDGKYIPRKVVYDMYRRFINEFPVVPPGGSIVPSIPAIIVDMDGTLSYVPTDEKGSKARSHYDTNGMINDKPNEAVVELVKMYESKGHDIIIVTGRWDESREETRQWLLDHDIQPEMILMRETGDRRKDRFVKHEKYRANIEGKYDVKAVFDDRAQSCLLWYDIGLPVFRFGDPIAEY